MQRWSMHVKCVEAQASTRWCGREVSVPTRVSSTSFDHGSKLQVVSYRVLKMLVSKEKIRFFLQFFFDKGENANQVAEVGNGVYGAGNVTAKYVEFGFVDSVQVFLMLQMHLAQAVENVVKITEIIEVYRHVNSHSIAQELKNDHKTVLSHLKKVGFKKKLHVWVPPQLTRKKTRWIKLPSDKTLPNGMKSTHFLSGG
ncbi:histone-lysine N-methyltransferase SETMAR [Trichonephila clavipes]|nr:histone-lysine N-methyltransferase SETMAR [Trichonephila clavipes]